MGRLKKLRLNDEERRTWVNNDESLYNWWRSSGKGLYRFVTENREELDKIIKAAHPNLYY